mgnify:CR=1 FL=1
MPETFKIFIVVSPYEAALRTYLTRDSKEESYTSVEEVYTALNGSSAGTTSAVTKSKAFNNLANGTYNTYVVIYDVAGNSVESPKVNVTLGTVTAATGATVTPTTWTNGKVNVTVKDIDKVDIKNKLLKEVEKSIYEWINSSK